MPRSSPTSWLPSAIARALARRTPSRALAVSEHNIKGDAHPTFPPHREGQEPGPSRCSSDQHLLGDSKKHLQAQRSALACQLRLVASDAERRGAEAESLTGAMSGNTRKASRSTETCQEDDMQIQRTRKGSMHHTPPSGKILHAKQACSSSLLSPLLPPPPSLLPPPLAAWPRH